MKIAVTYKDGQVFQHFGHTEKFKLYVVENGSIISASVVDSNGSGHGALAGLLGDLRADVLICGGIGAGARIALQENGIELCSGVSGDADDAVQALLDGTLVFGTEASCDHHSHSDGPCSSHGGSCGSHSCH